MPPHRRRAFAAIDLGTNNCRMLVARPVYNGFRVVDSFSRIVRLGEGLGRSGRLSEAAILRTIDALQACVEKLANWQVVEARHVATEACRKADNCSEFVARVRRETGLLLEPISAREEARLTLAGCAPLLDADPAHALVFDIGGGSTEVIWIRRDTEAVRIIDMLSLPCGVVSLTESFGSDADMADRFDRMVEHVDAMLLPFDAAHDIDSRIVDGTVQMVGTSGTVTTLGAVYLDLARYDRSRIDGLTLRRDHVLATSDRLSRMDWAARRAHPCIGEERADLVVAGCAILDAILRRWPVENLRIADRGIREGLLMDLMAQKTVGLAT